MLWLGLGMFDGCQSKVTFVASTRMRKVSTRAGCSSEGTSRRQITKHPPLYHSLIPLPHTIHIKPDLKFGVDANLVRLPSTVRPET